MIVVMKAGADQQAVERVAAGVEALGMKSHILEGTERRVVAAIGTDRAPGTQEKLAALAGVERVLIVSSPHKLTTNEHRRERTVVQAGTLSVGGRSLGLIAGPCSVESEEQIVRIAEGVKAAGAGALRGGAFKPRTSPYSFQGLKEEGLRLLAAAREATGLAVVTEVMAPGNVDLVQRHADVLQIGARNMQNYDLLTEVGKQSRPVLLKRGPAANVDEFLFAAEYVLDQGNQQVMLCERGIRTFETHTRFTLPVAVVPYLQQRTHLPVVIDPSHGTGVADLVRPTARAAVAAGCDGLIVEVHHAPAESWSDAAQTIDMDEFGRLVAECRRVAEAVDREL